MKKLIANLVLLVALAAVPQLLGHSVYNYALRRVAPTVVALVLLGEPIGSAALAFLILGESPPPGIYLGGAIILFGIALAIAPARNRGEATESEL